MRPRSLRSKLLIGTILVIVLVMTAVMAVVDHHERAGIISEMERRGEALARSLAAISAGPLLLYHFTALEQNVVRMAAEHDVVYAVVLDADGKVAAHSRYPERVGLLLHGAAAERAADTLEPLTQETVTNAGEAVYDFAVPVLIDGRKWGTVRLGLSKQRMEAELQRTRLELGALTLVALLIGSAAAALLARRIGRPVQQLAEGAAAISRGELRQRIEPSTEDEIGRLAAAFNHMAAELLQQRTALEEAHAGLRRQFEELADLKSYTDNILGSLTNGIVTIDLDGRLVTLNPAAELLTGFFRGEAVGRYCTELFAHTSEVSDLLTETLATRAPIASVPLKLRRRNGTTLPIEFSTAPLKGGEGKDLGVIGVFRDVTLVRRLESDLRRSDQLAALGTLAAGFAHEIKNPLTSLLTFSRHLDRRFDDPSFRERFRSVVPRELERINVIVENLLELARPPRLQFTHVRLPELIDRALELYVVQLDERRVEVVREYARRRPVGPGGQGRALPRVRQPDRQRARRDAAGRPAHGTRRVGRNPRPDARAALAAREPGQGRGRGHRRRHRARRHRPDLQPVLYRPGTAARARAGSRAQDRSGPRRRDQLPEPARPRHDLHARALADPRRAELPTDEAAR
jgi:two-component system sensor histidine kinase AtoS